MWFKWGVLNVLLPLMPFGLSVFFRQLADGQSPASPHILWNSELPFFTLVMGILNVQVFFEMQFLRKEQADLFDRLYKTVVGSAVVGGASLLCLTPYYLHQHVQQLRPTVTGSLQWLQLVFAVLQLGFGVGMRYVQVKNPPPGST